MFSCCIYSPHTPQRPVSENILWPQTSLWRKKLMTQSTGLHGRSDNLEQDLTITSSSSHNWLLRLRLVCLRVKPETGMSTTGGNALCSGTNLRRLHTATSFPRAPGPWSKCQSAWRTPCSPGSVGPPAPQGPCSGPFPPAAQRKLHKMNTDTRHVRWKQVNLSASVVCVLLQPKQLISFTQTTVSKGQVTRETIHNPWNWSGSSAVHFKRCRDRTLNIDVLIFWNLKQNKKQQQCTNFTSFYTDLAVYNVYHIMHKLRLFY